MASYAVVFVVCPVFSYIPAISFTRDKLLDIRKYTPPDISPDLVYSDVLLDIVVGGAAVLFRRFRTRRRGKRAGALVKLSASSAELPADQIRLRRRIKGLLPETRKYFGTRGFGSGFGLMFNG